MKTTLKRISTVYPIKKIFFLLLLSFTIGFEVSATLHYDTDSNGCIHVYYDDGEGGCGEYLGSTCSQIFQSDETGNLTKRKLMQEEASIQNEGTLQFLSIDRNSELAIKILALNMDVKKIPVQPIIRSRKQTIKTQMSKNLICRKTTLN